MSLTSLILAILIVALILWLINKYIPMNSKVKEILNILVVVFLILWILGILGVVGPINSIRIGR